MKKDYKINEAILVTYHALDSIYQHFCAGYPEEIEKEIVNLIAHLMEYTEAQDNLKNVDMIDYEIIKRINYEKIKNKKTTLY